MQPYFFSIKATPTAGTPEASNFKYALAIVAAISTDLETAEAMAIDYVISEGWKVESVQSRLQPTPEELPRLDTDMQALYRAALKSSPAGIFVGCPPHDRNDGLVEIRPLHPPYHRGNS